MYAESTGLVRNTYSRVWYQGWIACGGEGGLLKVLKLEVVAGPDAKLKVRRLVLFTCDEFSDTD